MILRRHWALAAVTAIGLHAVGLSVFAQKPDVGTNLPNQPGIEVELGMLGELISEPEPSPKPEPEPEPKPEPRPEPVQKADVQIKPEPKPVSKSVSKPMREFKPVSTFEPEPVAQAVSKVASNTPVDVDASPARASKAPREALRSGKVGSADKSATIAAGARTSWYAQVASHLARHKHYPVRARRMRHEAVVTLSFVVARDGSVQQAEITGPSRYRALNRAVQDMLERAKPLPVFPEDLPGETISLSIPVAFKLQ